MIAPKSGILYALPQFGLTKADNCKFAAKNNFFHLTSAKKSDIIYLEYFKCADREKNP